MLALQLGLYSRIKTPKLDAEADASNTDAETWGRKEFAAYMKMFIAFDWYHNHSSNLEHSS